MITNSAISSGVNSISPFSDEFKFFIIITLQLFRYSKFSQVTWDNHEQGHQELEQVFDVICVMDSSNNNNNMYSNDNDDCILVPIFSLSKVKHCVNARIFNSFFLLEIVCILVLDGYVS